MIVGLNKIPDGTQCYISSVTKRQLVKLRKRIKDINIGNTTPRGVE